MPKQPREAVQGAAGPPSRERRCPIPPRRRARAAELQAFLDTAPAGARVTLPRGAVSVGGAADGGAAVASLAKRLDDLKEAATTAAASVPTLPPAGARCSSALRAPWSVAAAPRPRSWPLATGSRLLPLAAVAGVLEGLQMVLELAAHYELLVIPVLFNGALARAPPAPTPATPWRAARASCGRGASCTSSCASARGRRCRAASSTRSTRRASSRPTARRGRSASSRTLRRGPSSSPAAPAAPSRAPDNLMLHPRLRHPAEPRNCCEKLVAAVFSW